MGTIYTGLCGEPVDGEDREKDTVKLVAAGFAIGIDDAGWIAEYMAGPHRVRVESTTSGWLVSEVKVVGSFERVKTAGHHEMFAEASRLAVKMSAALNNRLRTLGSVAGPLLAELRRTS